MSCYSKFEFHIRSPIDYQILDEFQVDDDYDIQFCKELAYFHNFVTNTIEDKIVVYNGIGQIWFRGWKYRFVELFFETVTITEVQQMLHPLRRQVVQVLKKTNNDTRKYFFFKSAIVQGTIVFHAEPILIIASIEPFRFNNSMFCGKYVRLPVSVNYVVLIEHCRLL